MENYEGDSLLALIDLSSFAQNILKHFSTSMKRGTDALVTQVTFVWVNLMKTDKKCHFSPEKSEEITFCMKKKKHLLFGNYFHDIKHFSTTVMCRASYIACGKKYVYQCHELAIRSNTKFCNSWPRCNNLFHLVKTKQVK